MKRLDGSVVVMVSVTGPVNALLDDISTAELSVTKFGMVMHRPKCHARRLVCFLQAHGHSVGSLFNNYFYDIHTCILLQLLFTPENHENQ